MTTISMISLAILEPVDASLALLRTMFPSNSGFAHHDRLSCPPLRPWDKCGWGYGASWLHQRVHFQWGFDQPGKTRDKSAITPVARGRLRIEINDDRGGPGLFGGMARDRASVVLPAPPFWAISAIVLMLRSILVYKLTLRIFDQARG
jgi:hypothetical protein